MAIVARWDIISFCNLKCIHCRSEEFYSADRQIYPSLEQALEIVDTLVLKGVTAINILGGEPFAYRSIFEVMRYASGQGLKVFVTTNGLMLPARRVRELFACGLSQITISLDGSCPSINDRIRGDGVFAKAAQTLKLLISEKNRIKALATERSLPTIGVNAVLTGVNRHDIPNLAAYCAELGVDSFRVSPLDEIGNAKDNLSALNVSASDQLELAEELMPLVASQPDLQITILDLKPLVLEYLYEKTGVPLAVGAVGCSACTKEIYVQPQGFASPCLATAKQSTLVTEGTIKSYVRELSGTPDLKDGRGFADFQSDFSRAPGAYQNFVPCNECAYAGTLCKPCPLGSVRSKTVVEEMCLIAKKRMNSLVHRDLVDGGHKIEAAAP